MATSQNQGFIEQLREMRATRTQQLRQSGQQSTLLNRQITAMTTLNKTMEAVLRAQTSSNTALKDINSKQSNISRQNEQMSKSINNLASSITRSMGSMASAVGRGASGAAGAIGSAGGSVVGAASSVASGVASSLAKVLPFAIAGVVGKMVLWDKMDDSVKKDLTDSFGNLVESIFGSIDTSGLKKVTAPITKEFGIVFGALGDTLDSMTKKLSEMVSILSKSIGGLTGVNTPGGASESFDKAKANARVLATTGSKVGGDIVDVAKSIGNIDSSDLGTAVNVVAGTTAVIGTAAILTGKGTKTPAAATPQPQTTTTTTTSQPRMGTAKKPRNLNPKEIARMQQAMSSLQKQGISKPSIMHMVEELSLGRVIAIGGDPAKRFFELFKQFKATGIGVVVNVLFASGLGYIIFTEVESLYENGIIDESEKREILEYLAKKETYIAGGGIIGGTLSGAGLAAAVIGSGGTMTGVAAYAAIPIVAAGSYSGSKFGNYFADKFITKPEVLTKNYSPFEFATKNLYDPVGTVEGRRSNKDSRRLDMKPQGAMNPSPASSTSESFERFKGAIGQAESGGDYGARNKSGSSASGKYQVIKDTFERFAKDKNSPVYGMTWEQYQKSSPQVQEALMDYMLQYYVQVLSAGKVPINEQTLYLAHFLGAETAVKVYNADPNDSLSKYITKNGLYDLMIKQNPGLITPGTTTGGIQLELGKRVSSRMAGNRPSTSTSTISSFAAADPSTATTSTSYAENYARRSKEAKDAEKYEEGSDSFVGPMMAKNEKSKPSALSAFASQFSIESFTSDFAAKTKELTDVVDSMFAAQTQQAPTIIADNSSVTNVTNNSSGGGGGPSINQVISNHMSNMNWQFNTLSGGARA